MNALLLETTENLLYQNQIMQLTHFDIESIFNKSYHGCSLVVACSLTYPPLLSPLYSQSSHSLEKNPIPSQFSLRPIAYLLHEACLNQTQHYTGRHSLYFKMNNPYEKHSLLTGLHEGKN